MWSHYTLSAWCAQAHKKRTNTHTQHTGMLISETHSTRRRRRGKGTEESTISLYSSLTDFSWMRSYHQTSFISCRAHILSLLFNFYFYHDENAIWTWGRENFLKEMYADVSLKIYFGNAMSVTETRTVFNPKKSNRRFFSWTFFH